jgi:hypothetical protein
MFTELINHYIVQLNHIPTIHNWDYYAQYGDVDGLKYLKNIGSGWFTSRTVDIACIYRNINVLHYLRRIQPYTEKLPCTKLALNRACNNGDISIVNFLMKHTTIKLTDYALNRAIQNGHSNVVTLLVAKFPDLMASYQSMNIAWYNGNYRSILLYLCLKKRRSKCFKKSHLLRPRHTRRHAV